MATLLVNLAGAFVLGLLLETLVRIGDDRDIRRQVRLLVGTGFLGAFTTYSTFAVETDLLVHDGHSPTAIAYAAISVVGGLVACVLGLLLAATRGRVLKAVPFDPDVDAEADRS